MIAGQEHSASINIAISKRIGVSVLNGILGEKRSEFANKHRQIEDLQYYETVLGLSRQFIMHFY